MDNTKFSAQDAVFSTYELFESIILALPAQDILLAAHVSEAWYSIITSSTAIGKHVQRGLDQFLNFWHRAAAEEGIYVENSFIWGKVIIRYFGDVESIVILPMTVPSSYCPLTRPLTGGEGKAVKIQWNSKRKGWDVKFKDPSTGTLLQRFISNYTDSRLAQYLAEYYGGYCTGVKVVKPLCADGPVMC